MRVLDREDFLKEPPGTVFCVVDACGTAGLYRKGETVKAEAARTEEGEAGSRVGRSPVEGAMAAAGLMPGQGGFRVRSLKPERRRDGCFALPAGEIRVNWGAFGGFHFLVLDPEDVAGVIEGLLEAI